MSDALRAAPPRMPAQVAAIVGRGGRGYRLLCLLIWGCVLGVPAFVALTSDDARLAVFGEGLLLASVMFGAPVQWFVSANLRQLRVCARDGLLLNAVVVEATLVGPPAQRVADVRLRCEVPGHGARLVRASGLAGVPPVGSATEVLFVAGRRELAGVVSPHVGIVMGRVSR